METETARCFPPSRGDQRQLDEVLQPCPALPSRLPFRQMSVAQTLLLTHHYGDAPS